MLPFVATRIDASFLQGLCLEEGYNIVAAHTQKPIPPTSEPLQSYCSQFLKFQLCLASYQVSGDVVNETIPIKNCSEEEHAKRRKDRSKYCIDCGKQLIQ